MPSRFFLLYKTLPISHSILYAHPAVFVFYTRTRDSHVHPGKTGKHFHSSTLRYRKCEYPPLPVCIHLYPFLIHFSAELQVKAGILRPNHQALIIYSHRVPSHTVIARRPIGRRGDLPVQRKSIPLHTVILMAGALGLVTLWLPPAFELI